jgi:hypothetical protein
MEILKDWWTFKKIPWDSINKGFKPITLEYQQHNLSSLYSYLISWLTCDMYCLNINLKKFLFIAKVINFQIHIKFSLYFYLVFNI